MTPQPASCVSWPRSRSGPPRSSRNRPSRLWCSGTTASIRPPRATMEATTSGTVPGWAQSSRSHSPSLVQRPNRPERRPPCSGQTPDLEPEAGTAVEHFGERARGHAAPVIDDADAVADLLCFAQQVGVQKHRGAARLDGADDLTHIVAADRVQCAIGLVEHDQVRITEERYGQPEALLHALGEVRHFVVRPVEQGRRLRWPAAQIRGACASAAAGAGNGS